MTNELMRFQIRERSEDKPEWGETKVLKTTCETETEKIYRYTLVTLSSDFLCLFLYFKGLDETWSWRYGKRRSNKRISEKSLPDSCSFKNNISYMSITFIGMIFDKLRMSMRNSNRAGIRYITSTMKCLISIDSIIWIVMYDRNTSMYCLMSKCMGNRAYWKTFFFGNSFRPRVIIV